jgi:hypothetical protein
LKQRLRVAILLSITCAAVAAFSNLAQAQKIDVGFGVSTVLAPSASSCSGNCQIPQGLGGGAYPGFNGDVLFWHNLGVGAEVFWRGSQGGGAYAAEQDATYRPIFYNFNGVYSPKIAHRVYGELVAGVGVMSTRLYQCETGSGTGCGIAGGNTAVAASHHFDADFGGGIKFYVLHGLFVRPEARFYWINNDTNFSGSYATRVGASIGYTFGGH